MIPICRAASGAPEGESMRKNKKTLRLNRDTVRNLDQDILTKLAGGSAAACSYTLCGTDVYCWYGKSHCPGQTCYC
jgi:hypothetical protein